MEQILSNTFKGQTQTEKWLQIILKAAMAGK